jgi:transposase
MEARRIEAAELFEQQVIPAEVARRVGVSHQIVSDWRTAWRQGGRDALRSAGRAGRKSKLTDDQLDQLVATFRQGAKANGYPTDLWTLARVAELIERVTGVRYHPGHVWYVLHDRLNWSRQRPARRATERNEAAIAEWVERRWPLIKKGQSASMR